MTEATLERTDEQKVKAPRKEVLQVGKTSIIVDGKEVVFNRSQKDLPGMPEISRLRRLADGFVSQSESIMEEQERLNKIRQAIMIELKQEGRTDFAFRKGEMTYGFTIATADEKLKVSKKK